MIAPCSCPLAGYCERHRINKTDHLWKQCQANEPLRAAFDRATVNIRPQVAGLGDAVAVVAKPFARVVDAVFGTDLTNCGGCAGRQQGLNVAGRSIVNAVGRMFPFGRR